MTTKLKINHLLTALFLFSTLGTATMAKDHGKHQGKRGFFKELNLTKEQKEKLKEHRSSNKGQMKGLRQEMRSLREQLSEAFVSGASDSTFQELNQKLSATKTKMEKSRYQKMLFFKNLLDKEQRVKFMEQRKKWRGKKGKFKNKDKGKN